MLPNKLKRNIWFKSQLLALNDSKNNLGITDGALHS